MAESLRYMTNEQGTRIGVVLDLAEYHRLIQQPLDADLLPGLSQAELQALAQSRLAPVAQARLDELLARLAAVPLAAEETAELDQLLEQVDQLTILKTRARYTLARQEALTTIGM